MQQQQQQQQIAQTTISTVGQLVRQKVFTSSLQWRYAVVYTGDLSFYKRFGQRWKVKSLLAHISISPKNILHVGSNRNLTADVIGFQCLVY